MNWHQGIREAPSIDAAVTAAAKGIAQELDINPGLGPSSGLPAWNRVAEILQLFAKRARRDEAAALARAYEDAPSQETPIAGRGAYALVGPGDHRVRS